MSKFKVGDKVRIIDNKQTHNAWKTAFKDNSISGYKVLFCHNNNEVVEVIKDFNQTLLFVRNENGTSLINIKGVEKVENFTRDDLKQGMVMIDRIGLERVMVNNNTYCNDGEIYHIERYYNIDLTNINNHTNYDIIKVTFGNETIYERPEPKTTWFEPKLNETYHHVNRGIIWTYGNDESEYDNKIFKSHMVYKTREEAEKHLEWHQAHIRILKEIARLNEGWTPDWEDHIRNKHFVALDSNYKTFKLTSNSIFKILPNNMYLKSEELANQLIETHKDDLLIYFEAEQ